MTGPAVSQRRYRTLPIRRWLGLALVATVLIPVIATAATTLTEFYTSLHAFSEAPKLLRSGAARWTDHTWQSSTRTYLTTRGIDFVLFERGHEVYRSSRDPLAGGDAPQQRTIQRVVIPGPRHEVAYIYSGGGRPSAAVILIPLAGLAALLLTLGVIAWLLRRTLIVPLAAASDATRRIAAGDLAIELPTSRVREVARLNAAFVAMSDELRASLQRQAAIEEERRLFVSAIAHDLRTPLFSLRGYLEGLEQGVATTPDKVAHYIQVCREKADALERLIADLFAYAKVEYMEGTLQRAPLELEEVLRKVVDGRQRDAEARGVSLRFDGPPEACSIEGDEQLLSRAVENLLDNALRYTPAGGSIEVLWRREDDHAQFVVGDTGPGIAPHDLPHLFEPMYRADPSRSRDTGGTGLGLAIARRILRAHGGDLTVTNRTTGGAAFIGTLPFLQRLTTGEEPAVQDPIHSGSA